jgi:3-oxoacyl-[acyl-carrier protein] reductase
MDIGLRGKVAVVMAASEGLGYGCARALAQAGAKVGICGRRADVVEAAAKTLQDETGAEVHAFAADVVRPGDANRVIEATLKATGARSLDVLINNGGGPPPGPADKFDDAAWKDSFELLVLSNVRACRAAFPHLKKSGAGAIVNIVSTSVKQPVDNLVLSNSLRSAVIGFAKTLSIEWAAHKIRVNNVCPGFMQTRRADEVIASQAKRDGLPFEEVRKKREAAIPLGRMGTIDELGQTVAFLASPMASYITGQTLSADGGATRWVHG